MKILLETHRFAPEQNVAHIFDNKRRHCGVLPAKNIKTLREYRAVCQRALEPAIYARITTHYPPDQQWLERTITGRVATRQQALHFAAIEAAKLAPGGVVKVQTFLWG